MVDKQTPLEALRSLEKKAGSQAALARGLKLSTTAVWKWFQSSKRIPAEHVLLAESLYGISRHELRPDIYPVDLEPTPEQRARFLGVDMEAVVSGS